MKSQDLQEGSPQPERRSWQTVSWPLVHGDTWPCLIRYKDAHKVELSVVLPKDVIPETVVLAHIPATKHAGGYVFVDVDTPEAYTVSYVGSGARGGFLLEVAAERETGRSWSPDIYRITRFGWHILGTVPDED